MTDEWFKQFFVWFQMVNVMLKVIYKLYNIIIQNITEQIWCIYLHKTQSFVLFLDLSFKISSFC